MAKKVLALSKYTSKCPISSPQKLKTLLSKPTVYYLKEGWHKIFSFKFLPHKSVSPIPLNTVTYWPDHIFMKSICSWGGEEEGASWRASRREGATEEGGEGAWRGGWATSALGAREQEGARRGGGGAGGRVEEAGAPLARTRRRGAGARVSANDIDKLNNTYTLIKGTQDWEFFWLRFWNLYYFFVSYVKILRFYRKFFFVCDIIGGVTIFPRGPRTTQNEKKFWGRSKNFFFFLQMNPLYEPILVFRKFDLFTAYVMALSVNLGPKCQNLFPLVWD